MHWKLWVLIFLVPIIVAYFYMLFNMKCKTDKPMQDLHKPSE